MKAIWFLAGALALPLPALAADVTEPVRAVMAAAEANWSQTPGEFQDYFSPERLGSLYSEAFADLYRKAADTPFAKEMGTPFDWDVIVNGQDGCPLKNLSVAAAGQDGPATLVVARFQGLTCFGAEAEYQAFQETTFRVVQEGGRPVIDDIVHVMDGERMSLKAQMDAIIKDQP